MPDYITLGRLHAFNAREVKLKLAQLAFSPRERTITAAAELEKVIASVPPSASFLFRNVSAAFRLPFPCRMWRSVVIGWDWLQTMHPRLQGLPVQVVIMCPKTPQRCSPTKDAPSV